MTAESGVLEDYYGTLAAETAAELERIVSDRRTRRSSDRRERVERIAAVVDADSAD